MAALRKAGYRTGLNLSNKGAWKFWAPVPGQAFQKSVSYERNDRCIASRSGGMALSWSGDGKEIERILAENNVRFKWEGDPGSCFQIIVERVEQ